MKKILLWILTASILLTSGCSYIEYTQGADSGFQEGNAIVNDDNSSIQASDIIQDTPDTSGVPNDTEANQSNDFGPDSSKTGNVDEIAPTYAPSGKQEADDKNDEISQLRVHFIDVGQGDSILIEADNRYMLIDAGERDKGTVVIDYLENIGVKKLDYVIATHPHSDHIGGLADVIKHFSIGKIIMPNAVHTSKTYENLLDIIADKGLKITKAVVGNKYDLADASFTILAPSGSEYSSLNNYSVAIKLQNGNNSFVFTGDAEVQSENEMLKTGIDLDADVLKLGHHGSSTSNSDKFLDAVTPDMAVISVGEGNQYGHPDDEVLQAMKDRNIKLYRTDEQGTIIIESDGNKITVNKTPYKITDKSDKTVQSQTDTKKSDKTASSTAAGNSKTGKTDTKKSDTSKSAGSKTDKSDTKNENAKNIIVHITKTGSKYHRAGCKYLKTDIEVTLEEALNKGLSPCKVCNPPTK